MLRPGGGERVAAAAPGAGAQEQEKRMSPEYAEGLRIMAVGIGGVFANLILVMLLVMGLKAVFGKKPKKKES
jgi:hypothetical protein